MTGEEVFLQAFTAHPVGILFGIGFIILCLYIGMTLLFNGWPERRRK